MLQTANTLLEAALDYAQKGFAVIPLHYPIINKNGTFCSCHKGSDCDKIGKHPQFDKNLIAHGAKDATIDESIIRQWWDLWPSANVGLATGAQNGFIAIDCDSQLVIDNAQQNGLPNTPRSSTGKGQHALFKHPGFIVRNDVKIDGFDFRGDGGLIVAPPSKHYSGKRYTWITDLDTPFAECPDWIVALIKRTTDQTNTNGFTQVISPIDTRYGIGALNKAIKDLTSAQNGERNNLLFKQTAAMFSLVAGGELTEATVNHRLHTAASKIGLTSDEITKTIESAKQYGTITPRSAPNQTPSQQIGATFKQLGYTFRLNDCDNTIEVNGAVIDDPYEAEIIIKMRDHGFKGDNLIRNAIKYFARQNRYHPIKDYLTNLKWDNQDHIRKLSTYLHDIHPPIVLDDGTQETVIYAYLKRWFIGAVGKVFVGAQNIMLVFVSEQDLGKSALAAFICSGLPKYFESDRINPNDKDHVLRLASKFIWDADELDATTRKTDVAALKSFITRAAIDVRKAYGHNNTQKPAIVSFIGTVNPDGVGFLVDETGNRRFLTVELSHIDWSYTEVDINQVWAQAVALHNKGENHRLTTIEKQVQATINQQHEPQNILQDYLVRYFNIKPQSNDFLSTIDILLHIQANGIDIRMGDRSAQMSLAKAAKKLGLHKHAIDNIRGYIGINKKSVEVKIYAYPRENGKAA